MSDTPPPPPSPWLLPHTVWMGILLMIASLFCFAAMNVTIGMLAGGMHSGQIVFIRNIMSLILVMIWIFLMPGGGRHLCATNRLQGHFWRSFLGTIAMELWFYSLTIMPLTLATALSFTTPVFATVLAIFILKEKAGWRRWGAVLTGFVGVIVILHPDTRSTNAAAGLVLFTSFLMALSGIVVKTLTRTQAPETIVFYMGIFMTPLSAPLAFAHWQPITAHQALLIFLIALFSTSAHLLITRAYQRADMVILVPFDFLRLVFTSIFAYFLFGEVLDAHTAAGAAIIVASAAYIAGRERLRRKSLA